MTRYEAVLLRIGAGSLSPELLGTIGELRVAGMHVGVLGTVHDATVDALAAAESSGAVLVWADPYGADVVTIDESGSVERLGADPAAFAAPVVVGRAVVDRLSTMAVNARHERVSAGAVAVTLADPGTLDAQPSVSGLVELAREVAVDAGAHDVRVFAYGDAGVLLAPGDEADACRGVLDVLWRRGIAPDAVVTVDAAAAAEGVPTQLADQIAARRAGALPTAAYEPGWGLAVDEYRAERDAVTSSLFVLADGRIGISGAPLGEASSANRWVLAAGVYTGTGAETHMLEAPLPWHVGAAIPEDTTLRRIIDLRTGAVHEALVSPTAGYRSTRFCSLARPGTSVLRVAPASAPADTSLLLAPGPDGASVEAGRTNGVAWMRVAGTGGGGVAVAAVERHTGDPGAGTCSAVDRVAAFAADGTHAPDLALAIDAARRDSAAGFDRLLNEHRRAWSARWDDADVVIEGDDDLQTATRFALFHLMGSVHDRDEAAVGARGLTGPSYRGHVFWDADTFVLPFLAATHPSSARAMLEYRVRRLPAAIEAARRMGRAGARFPWESAASGAEVTPPSARDRTGRIVPIRTGLLEDHIVAQVAWAACFYVDWTGDDDFERGPGQRLLIETARYWAGRARTEPDGTAHIYGVIGPDEYHEPVDDNTFTNVIARWNLRRALAALEHRGTPHDVTADEQRTWRDLADALVDGFDANSGIYEQFAGFHKLEPLLIAEAAPRRPIAADLLLGPDRVRASQVIKQADVLMLHHLIPEETVPDSLDTNLRYYEPRTAHGSSLSPAIHAALFARARDFERALPALRIASRIDLDDLTGSTAGGLHLATMGGLWQAFAFGFAGMRAREGMLHVEPRLPPTWRSLEMRVRFRGSRVRVRIESSNFEVISEEPRTVMVAGEPASVGPSATMFRRKGASWEAQ